MRRYSTYLLGLAAGFCVILAPSGSVQAAEHAFSSILSDDLGRALDSIRQESQLQASTEDYVLSTVAEDASAVEFPVTTAPVPSDVELAVNPGDWSELEAYEEFRDSRLAMFLAVSQRKPARLVAFPVLPGQGSDLGSAARSQVGTIDAPFRFRTDRPNIVPTKLVNTFANCVVCDAAVNLALRDYYSYRNGYNGEDATVTQVPQPALAPLLRSNALILFEVQREILLNYKPGFLSQFTMQTSTLSIDERDRKGMSKFQVYSFGDLT